LLSPNSQGFKVFIRIFAVQIILLFPKITIFPNLWDILSSRVNRKSKAFEKWQKEGFFCECVWRAGREWRSLLIIATKNRLKSKIGGNDRVNCLETNFDLLINKSNSYEDSFCVFISRLFIELFFTAKIAARFRSNCFFKCKYNWESLKKRD
jgi:hypothetical protein